MSVICKFWTRNIKHDDADRQGSANIYLMVDGNADYFNDSNITTESIKESSSSSSSSMYQSSTVFLTEALSAQVTKDVISVPKDLKTTTNKEASVSFETDQSSTTVNTRSS